MKVLQFNRVGSSNRQGLFEKGERKIRVGSDERDCVCGQATVITAAARSRSLAGCFSAILFSLIGTLGFAQTIPDEVAIAKAKFLKKAEAAVESQPTDLNEKYVAGLEALQEKKKNAGDLDSTLAIKKEIETVKATSAPGTTEVSEASGLSEMREIYADARRKWNNSLVDELEVLKASYLAALEVIMTDFTKAGKIDEALATRTEAQNVAAITIKDFNGNAAPVPAVAVGGDSGGKRQGRVRGFGRTMTSKWHPDWKDLDLTPLHQYSDFVEVAGSQYHVLFRRANGDVLDRDGKTVGQNAAKLMPAASQIGYVDSEGKYYAIYDGDVPTESQPLKSLVKKNYRRLAIKRDGDIVAWGGQYESNEREVPEGGLKNIKQIAMFWDDDFALTESGELFRWNQKKVFRMPPQVTTGVEKISIYHYTGFVLSKTNDLYYLNGNLAPFWDKKAKNIICRGEFAAIMDMENRWHIFAYNKTPRGSELEVLHVVMNRPETIDVEFNLFNSKQNNKDTASYAVWIEDLGAGEIDVTNTSSLPTTTAPPRKSGTGFFGTDLD